MKGKHTPGFCYQLSVIEKSKCDPIAVAGFQKDMLTWGVDGTVRDEFIESNMNLNSWRIQFGTFRDVFLKSNMNLYFWRIHV